MKEYVIAYFCVMAAIIIFGVLAIKYLVWWNGFFIVLAVQCGIGMWLGDEIWSRSKHNPKNKKARK